MIDTVGYKIPIDRSIYDHLLTNMTTTQRTDKKVGVILFAYHNSTLEFSYPSWNYKVVFRLSDEIWEYHKASKHPIVVKGFPHISIEYSVPKILVGNNLISLDTCLIYESMHMVRDSFAELFKVYLPCPNEWHCYRIDTCGNYILENAEQVKNFISYLQRLDYPRKIKNCYQDSGLYFASSYQTLKIYWKGPEFKKHDMKRCKNEQEAKRYLLSAQNILRVEVEHKKRLRYLVQTHEKENGVKFIKFDGYPCMKDFIEIFDFKTEMRRIMDKFLCGTEPKVMKATDVYNRLLSKYSERQARSFHHVYTVIVTQGQKEARKIFAEGTYYRARKAFRERGISLIASDGTEEGIYLDHGFPSDFSLEMEDSNPYYQKPLYECLSSPIEGEEEPF